jgi:hypothetical protein
MKEIEIKIKEEALQALFQGQKVVFDYLGQPRITLYPPRYGYFMTYEKKVEIERMALNKAFEEVIKLLKD